jgi:hypothetical protein
MKKVFFTLVFCVSLIQLSSAQSIFFELGGPGLASFNFDTRFSNRNDGFGGRIGVGGLSIDGAGVVFMPVALNYLLGKDNRNYFELGVGATPVFGSDGGDSDFSETFGHLNFGYRLQPADGGFQFRAFMCPIFGDGFFIPYFGGVSFGYAF